MDPSGPRAHKDERQARYLFAFGRLNPDVSRQPATEDLDAIAGRLAQQYPVSNESWTADVYDFTAACTA